MQWGEIGHLLWQTEASHSSFLVSWIFKLQYIVTLYPLHFKMTPPPPLNSHTKDVVVFFSLLNEGHSCSYIQLSISLK